MWVEKTYIKGIYKRAIFSTEKGYIVGIFRIKETNREVLEDYVNKTITFTGYFHELKEEDTYFFYGEEITHPKYGLQFQVQEYEPVKPEDKDGVIAFLSSGLFKGIGEKMAATIVEALGENALERILEEPECLMLVPKLTAKKANEICKTLTLYEESHKMIVYLTELGFSMKDALVIYNTYKQNTISKIEHNIYELIEDIEEITFPKVDVIAHHQNILEDDEDRVKACIVYTMSSLLFKSGDTYLSYQEIYENTLKELKIDLLEDLFREYLYDLIDQEKVVEIESGYMLKSFFDAEERIVQKFRILLSNPGQKISKLSKYMKESEEKELITYNEQQKQAIKDALTNNLLVITGGPGTGKTTIIRAIVDIYKNSKNLSEDELTYQLALLAPTGRASKRMSESTLYPAMTIHRFLKWNKENNRFGIDEYNKDNSTLVIIDEVSMIDLLLFDHLLKGLTDQIKLILVGDFNQLPSVGPGTVLKDLIESNVIPTVHLDTLYRQGKTSYIPILAKEIRENTVSQDFLIPKSDYLFLECSGYSIKENLKSICMQMIQKGYDYKRVQVMAPMYASVNGIDNLNKELQDVFNPPDSSKKELRVGDILFRENDKILQLVNDPDNNIFNGDIGVIKQIVTANISASKKNEIYVDYDGNTVKYLPKDFIKMKHGFIISIHKSQGSEFELVVIPICSSYKRMLYRKLIYTGITRAKKKLILLGEKDAFLYSVHNTNEYIRKTKLKEKLYKNLYTFIQNGKQ